MRRRNLATRSLIVLTTPLFVACGPEPIAPGSNADADSATRTSEPISVPNPTDVAPRDLPGLHNVVAFHDNFYSGSVPEGDEAFATLAAMGVRTIISVDGAAPDAEAARIHGIRYIHLPIGYNGFDDARERQLARASRDAIAHGPVYIHCHHGKHRSAGAAATVSVNLGWATPEEAVARMRVSGTSNAYQGLYACAASAEPLDEQTLDAVPADFPEVSVPTGMVAGMVEIDEIMEHLRAIQAAGWRTPDDHPDLVPAAEAGRLADLFRVLGESDHAADHDADFVERLNHDSTLATTLETALIQGQADSADGPAILSDHLARLAASCTDCHAAYRD
ncbi:MAG: hypothetical protein R3B68_05725 [Phycisphaerales bacterium]